MSNSDDNEDATSSTTNYKQTKIPIRPEHIARVAADLLMDFSWWSHAIIRKGRIFIMDRKLNHLNLSRSWHRIRTKNFVCQGNKSVNGNNTRGCLFLVGYSLELDCPNRNAMVVCYFWNVSCHRCDWMCALFNLNPKTDPRLRLEAWKDWEKNSKMFFGSWNRCYHHLRIILLPFINTLLVIRWLNKSRN